MRNTAKTNTLERMFPILAVENNCIVSKQGDITVCYKVILPEIFTISDKEYETIHSVWHKAIKTLPEFTVIHKQDWFVKESYEADFSDAEQSYLSRSFERHFNERSYLNHSCYLFITKTTKERIKSQSNFSSLTRGELIPKEIRDKDAVLSFLEATAQLEKIVNDSGLIHLTKLTEEDIIGSEEKSGLLEQYLTLSPSKRGSLQDIAISSDKVRIGDNSLSLHTLSNTEDLPSEVSYLSRYEKLSTDKSSMALSFASPVGLLLNCNHIYNQFLFLEDSDYNLKQFEKSAKNMHSLARYSRANQINKQWIEEYLNEAHSKGLTSIKAHFNEWLGQIIQVSLNSLKMTVEAQLLPWSAYQDTIRLMLRHFTGQVCQVIAGTFQVKRAFIPS